MELVELFVLLALCKYLCIIYEMHKTKGLLESNKVDITM